MKREPARDRRLVETERAYELLQNAWRRQLSVDPLDWKVLFQLHYDLVRNERRLRLLRRPA